MVFFDNQTDEHKWFVPESLNAVYYKRVLDRLLGAYSTRSSYSLPTSRLCPIPRQRWLTHFAMTERQLLVPQTRYYLTHTTHRTRQMCHHQTISRSQNSKSSWKETAMTYNFKHSYWMNFKAYISKGLWRRYYYSSQWLEIHSKTCIVY